MAATTSSRPVDRLESPGLAMRSVGEMGQRIAALIDDRLVESGLYRLMANWLMESINSSRKV